MSGYKLKSTHNRNVSVYSKASFIYSFKALMCARSVNLWHRCTFIREEHLMQHSNQEMKRDATCFDPKTLFGTANSIRKYWNPTGTCQFKSMC